MTDGDKARLMTGMIEAAMDPTTADGRAGLKAALREIEAADPGALQRVADRIALLRLRRSATTAQ